MATYSSDTDSLDREKLLSHEEGGYDTSIKSVASERKSRQQSIFLKSSICLNVLLLGLGVFVFIWTSHQNSNFFRIPRTYYSPAESAVEYKTTVFQKAIHTELTEYQGPEDEVNEKWEELYNLVGMTEIEPEEAARLPNKTTPAAWDKNKYIVQLDVFHQLHCLNLLRKRLYPDKYTPDQSEDAIMHLSHCVDSMRQSLMCHSDIATINFYWSDAHNQMKGNLETTHICKDFSKIRQWAAERQMRGDLDPNVHVEGAPRVPV